jgi:hypothetical protein
MTAQQANNLLQAIEGSQDPRIRDFLASETGLTNSQSGFVTPQMIEEMTPWGFFIWAITHSDPVW